MVFVATFFFVLSLSLMPTVSRAQDAQHQQLNNNPEQSQQLNNRTKTFTLQNPLKVDSVGGLVQNFVEIFSYIAILFAVLMLIWVGFQFIMARGNSTRMNELKDWLIKIVIGVAVIIGARIIIQIVINTLSSTGVVDQRTIQSAQKAASGN